MSGQDHGMNGAAAPGAVAQYLRYAADLMAKIAQTQGALLGKAAILLSERVASDGIIYTFGSGHSHMVAEEVFVRAGTLTCVRALYPALPLDLLEEVEGVGRALMAKVDLRPTDALIVISQSGVNPLPIDVALAAKERGLLVVAITSLTHTRATAPKHASGYRLADVADLVLDNGAPLGDASLDIGLPVRVGPVSSLGGIALIQSLLLATAEALRSCGFEPPVRMSRNVPGGREYDEQFVARYGDRIPELRF